MHTLLGYLFGGQGVVIIQLVCHICHLNLVFTATATTCSISLLPEAAGIGGLKHGETRLPVSNLHFDSRLTNFKLSP